MLRSSPDFEVCEPQSLGIVCFRFRPHTGRDDGDTELNSINQAALERLQLGGEAFVSSTSLNGAFWLRACVLNPRTTTEDLHALLDALRGSCQPIAAIHVTMRSGVDEAISTAPGQHDTLAAEGPQAITS